MTRPDTGRVWVYDLPRGGLTPVTAANESRSGTSGRRMGSASPTPPRIRHVAALGRRRRHSRCTAFLAPLPHTKLVVERRTAARARRTDADNAGRHLGQELSDPKRPRRPLVQTAASETSQTFHPTASGWPTRRTSPVATRSTSSRILVLGRASRFRPTVAAAGLDQQRNGNRLRRPGGRPPAS